MRIWSRINNEMYLLAVLGDGANQVRVQVDHGRLNLLQQLNHRALATLFLRLERIGLECVKVGLTGARYEDLREPLCTFN